MKVIFEQEFWEELSKLNVQKNIFLGECLLEAKKIGLRCKRIKQGFEVLDGNKINNQQVKEIIHNSLMQINNPQSDSLQLLNALYDCYKII